MRRTSIVAALCVLLVAPALAQEEGGEEGVDAVAPAAEASDAAPEGEAAVPESEAAAPTKKSAKPEVTSNLAALLEKVRVEAAAERAEDEEREAAFRRARDEQAEQLRVTEAAVRAEEQQSAYLDTTYGENEVEIEVLGERLTERLGQMGELFGVVRLVSTDMSAQTWDSLTSASAGNRGELLERLGRSSDLPSTDDLERLWYEVQREMTEQGRIVRETLPVITVEGEGEAPNETEPMDVVRVGPFTAFSDVGYLRWENDDQMVRTLERQPPSRYVDSAIEYLHDGSEAFQMVAVDPSRGVLLEALTDTPSLIERVEQGGYVGYTIIGLGVFALVLGALRLATLTATGRRVDRQTRSDRADDGNPLGRLLGVYEEYRMIDPESLEQKLDESVLRESPRVQRHVWFVQTISNIAPLLGLLGTVTGMIQTFQAITLFGAGDPKMMASGISEALETTTLGLVIAIPLVLLHALLTSRSRHIIDLLEERCAALRATRLQEMSS
jgi:biopolymer transport protein ExbB